MDFYRIKEQPGKGGSTIVFPDFKVVRSKDLMIRGRAFYAIWDEAVGLWSTDEYDVQRLVDDEVRSYCSDRGDVSPKYLSDFSSNIWMQFRKFVNNLSDSSHQLDEHLTFSNTDVKKESYVSRRLSYPLAPGDHAAWDELIGTLYEPSERAKLEWAIGAIVAGDSKTIQKFLVLYGPAGTGKSTILNIIQRLFEGYYTTFEAKALTSSSNAFSTEVFKSNPLVAIQHDGDLSKIEDNTKLNSIISHEDMTMNEKYKPSYMAKINAFLFMGTNKPVKITDAKSGIIRRLIDVQPSGDKVSPRRYQTLMSKIDFELGAIAHHCLETYRAMGKDYYSGYRPIEMMLQTDVFFNFIEAYYDVFKEQNGVSLKQGYTMYNTYCEEAQIEYKLPRHKFRTELRNYFDDFEERSLVSGVTVRSWYSGFNADRFKTVKSTEEHAFSLVMDEEESLFDKEMAHMPAQYAKADEMPRKYWDDSVRLDKDGKEFTPKPEQIVDTTLEEIDTSQLHYVKVPENHIVIDFDLTDADGNKSAERNLEAASTWPSTYAEFSKGGAGIHLHYLYDGDVSELARVYDDGIEIKVYTGNSSLRRKLTKCNAVPVATINSGLPIREKKMFNPDKVKSERAIRDLIERNLRKEIHPGTKPSMDFIYKILEDAYKDPNFSYDVTDMRQRILAFANNSSNQALYCIKLVQNMHFKSEDVIEEAPITPKDERLVFYDVEVFPNLFIVCWKYQGDANVVRMINPSPQQMEELMAMKLVGFYNRLYDNHIIYARYNGYSIEDLYHLSKKMISGSRNAHFGAAYNISYADIYDFSTIKQSLKKFELMLDIPHKEWGGGWDEPVPEDKWFEVVEYCVNDVMATEATFENRKEDFIARLILADLSGLPVNATTRQHTSKIVFNGASRPQETFVYTDLSERFHGYKYDFGISTYRDEITGEGGYVYAEPGMYYDVALLDVASMHPTSIEQLDLFGPYTENYSALKAARLAIKRGDYDAAKQMFGGKLARHLSNEDGAEALAYALKIVINIVYGLTSAKFDNDFKDPRNIDNIVAKRGALFMIDLKHFVQEQGFTVAHIKTDSIKIPNATPEIIRKVTEFGKNYGYDFEHEATYEKMCLVNEAVYVAKYGWAEKAKKIGTWEAVGAEFQHPYIFKTLFSHEPVKFRDMCETKTVNTALYLDFSSVDKMMFQEQHKPQFVGKAGLFVPVTEGGGLLVRSKELEGENGEKITKYYSVAGTKNYHWMEAETVKTLGKQKLLDMAYYEKLIYDAKSTLDKFGDANKFLS